MSERTRSQLSRDLLDETTKAALDILPLGVCALEEDLKIVAWNRTLEDWTGIAKAEALGESLAKLFPNINDARYHDRLMQVFHTGCPAVMSSALHNHFIPLQNRSSLGTPHMVQHTEIRQLSKTPPRVLIMMQDVTELAAHIKQLQAQHRELAAAQEAAEEANRLKTAFLANMSHEIRTPMAAILGYTDILLQAGVSDPDQLAHLSTIKRSGSHLMAIINDILDISKIEAGRLEVELIEGSPCEIVEEVLYLMRPRAREKGISLNASYACPIARKAICDPTRFRQILTNLVGNSIKFTDEGSVDVHVRCEDRAGKDALRVEVADTGIGIAPDQVARLFDPFEQADLSTTRRFGGTGLGLTICKRLIQGLGGEIEVASVPGRGSEFCFTMPVQMLEDSGTFSSDAEVHDTFRNALNAVPIAQGAQHSARPLQGARILLAEDSPEIQRLVKFHLERAGAEVCVAENGRTAVDRVRWAGRGRREVDEASPFHLVLMDMQMPVLDGYAAVREIRELKIDIPVIALTAHSGERDRAKCIDAGCDDFGKKPIDREALIELCSRWLGTSANRQAA